MALTGQELEKRMLSGEPFTWGQRLMWSAWTVMRAGLRSKLAAETNWTSAASRPFADGTPLIG